MEPPELLLLGFLTGAGLAFMLSAVRYIAAYREGYESCNKIWKNEQEAVEERYAEEEPGWLIKTDGKQYWVQRHIHLGDSWDGEV